MMELGTTDLQVHPLCLGGNVFGWTVDEHAAAGLLDAYVDHGGNFIDTADVYPAWAPGRRGGESEELIGQWMADRGHRDRLVVSTKIGRMPGCAGLSRTAIRQAVEGSLRRLRTDRIDLLYAHADDATAPFSETFAAFDELIDEGKVRYVAASNYAAGRLQKALAPGTAGRRARFTVCQAHYNLLERRAFEVKLRPVCQEHDLAVVAYFPLAAGFLTGKYVGRATAPPSPRADAVAKYHTPKGVAVVAALRRSAERHGVPPAAVALAWLLRQPAISAVAASARTPAQLGELLEYERVDFCAQELDELRTVSDWPAPPVRH